MQNNIDINVSVDTDGVVQQIKTLLGILQSTAKQAESTGKKMDDALGNAGKEAKEATQNVDNFAEAFAELDNKVKNLGKGIGAYFAFDKLKEFAQSVIQVRGEIESLEISFKTLLGDEQAADKLFSAIREFAVSTPMQVDTLAKGAQTLLGFGTEVERIMPLLQQIGDISMGDAAKFESLTLSFAQASAAGKLMGGDLMQMINAGFNPLAELSKSTGKSIGELKEDMEQGKISAEMLAQAFQSATAEGGKYNGMLLEQSKGIKGAISNLEGAWADVLNEVGTKTQGAFVGILDISTKLIKNYTTLIGVVASVAAAYGTYKAALMGAWVIEKSRNMTAAIQSMLAMRKELGLLTAAQKAFNLEAMKNPYIMLASVIVGTIGLVYTFARANEKAATAEERAAEAAKKHTEVINERREKIDGLVSTIQDESATEFEKEKAYQELTELSPALTEAYTKEQLAVAELTDANKKLNEEQDKLEHKRLTGNVEQLTQKYKSLNEQIKSFTNSEAVNSVGGAQHLEYLKKLAQQAAEDLEIAQKELQKYEEIQAEVADNRPPEVKLAEYNAQLDELKKQKDAAQRELDKVTSDFSKVIQGKVKVDWQVLGSLDDLNAKIEDVKRKAGNAQAQVDASGSNKNYKDAKEAAKKAYEDAKKNAEAIKNSTDATVSAYNKAKEDLAAAKKAYEDLGGDTSTTPKKTNAGGLTKEQIANNVKVAQEALKQANNDITKAIENVNEQNSTRLIASRIKIERDAFKRSLEELKENGRQTIAQLKKNAEDEKKQVLDAIKKRWEAEQKLKVAQAGNNKKGVVEEVFDFNKLDEETQRVYNEQVKAIDTAVAEAIKNESTATQTAIKELEDDTFNQLLQDFGGYAEQRLQIEERYNKSLIELNNARAIAEQEADTEEGKQRVQRLNALIEEIGKKRAEELKQFDFAQFQQNMNLGDIVGNVQGMRAKGLEEMASALRKVIDANKDLSPEGLQRLQTLNDALTKIYAVQAEKNPVESLKRALEDFDMATATKKIAEANAETAGEMMFEGEQLAAKYAEAVATGNVPLQQTLLAVETAFKGADGKAMTYGDILKQVAKTSKDVSIATERVKTATTENAKQWQLQAGVIGKANSIISKVSAGLRELGHDDIAAVLDSVTELGDAVMGSINDIKTIVDGNAEAMTKTGMAAFNALSAVEKASVILAIVSAAIQIITKIFNVAKEMHNAKLQDDIDDANDKIEKLKNSYEDLQEAADKAFSKEKAKVISQENQNLRRQNELIRQQIQLEERMKEDDKQKKSKIEDYQNTIRENEKLMAENKEAMRDAIFGEDIQSAISNFADAYTSALADGTGVKKAAKQMVVDMMKSMITESMKADLATPMQNLRNKMEAMYADNIISDSEQKQLEAEAERISGQLKAKYEWADKLLSTGDQDLQGTANGWATASQESIDELNGRFAQSQSALQGSFAALLENNTLLSTIESSLSALYAGLGDIQELAATANSHLEEIEKSCKRIVAATLPHFANVEQQLARQ